MPNNPITSQETLSDYVRRIRIGKRLSCKDIERQSARYGKRIAGSYVNRIENDPNLHPTAVALQALANGLGVPVPELMARAFGLASFGGHSSEEFSLITRFRELSPGQQHDVLNIVDMLHSKRADSRANENRPYTVNS